MSLSQFTFVRHGQSQANADGIIADASSPLTEKGIEQAKEAASKLKDPGVTMIVHSPFMRARQTAEIIAMELGISSIRAVDELRERGLGNLEGKLKTHPSEWYSESDDDPTIEPRQALLDRMHVALVKLKQLDGKVLVVGHAVSGFYLVKAANGVKNIADLGPDDQIANADFIEIAL